MQRIRAPTWAFAAARSACACALALGAAACAAPRGSSDAAADAGDPFAPTDTDASLGQRVDRALASCRGGPESGCHTDGAGHLRLDLRASGDVVGVPAFGRPDLLRVAPRDPGRSYVLMKVTGNADDAGLAGTTMPPSGAADPRLAPLLASWIEAGAPAP